MSLSLAEFDRISALTMAYPCPLCSTEQREGMPGSVLRFPSFIKGRQSGLTICADGCIHAQHLILEREWSGNRCRSPGEAFAAWRAWAEQEAAKPRRCLSCNAELAADDGRGRCGACRERHEQERLNELAQGGSDGA